MRAVLGAAAPSEDDADRGAAREAPPEEGGPACGAEAEDVGGEGFGDSGVPLSASETTDASTDGRLYADPPRDEDDEGAAPDAADDTDGDDGAGGRTSTGSVGAGARFAGAAAPPMTRVLMGSCFRETAAPPRGSRTVAESEDCAPREGGSPLFELPWFELTPAPSCGAGARSEIEGMGGL